MLSGTKSETPNRENEMDKLDAVFIGILIIGCSATIVIGGLFHPNTIAGAIARFFWSVSV